METHQYNEQHNHGPNWWFIPSGYRQWCEGVGPLRMSWESGTLGDS